MLTYLAMSVENLTAKLGYDELTKGYRLYCEGKKKIICSRDVRFVELPQDTVADDDGEPSDTAIPLDNGEDIDQVQSPQTQPDSLKQPRRSTRNRHTPVYYGMEHTNVATDAPFSQKEINDSPEKEKWKLAMKAEMDSLAQNKAWELVKLPARRKVVGSKWVFKKKVGADGQVKRFKALPVAQGFTQKYSDETICPVMRLDH